MNILYNIGRLTRCCEHPANPNHNPDIRGIKVMADSILHAQTKGEKPCIHCKEIKPLSDFYKHKRMSDGHLNACKECVKARARRNREQNIDYYQAYDRERVNLPHRVEARKRYAQTEEGREKANAAKRRYIERNSLVRAAHLAVNSAIRDGKLIKQPCEVCAAIEDVQAHHDDYSKPLDVRWLCVYHHAQHHKQERMVKRNMQLLEG